jgi:hypothetical protein
VAPVEIATGRVLCEHSGLSVATLIRVFGQHRHCPNFGQETALLVAGDGLPPNRPGGLDHCYCSEASERAIAAACRRGNARSSFSLPANNSRSQNKTYKRTRLRTRTGSVWASYGPQAARDRSGVARYRVSSMWGQPRTRLPSRDGSRPTRRLSHYSSARDAWKRGQLKMPKAQVYPQRRPSVVQRASSQVLVIRRTARRPQAGSTAA